MAACRRSPVADERREQVGAGRKTERKASRKVIVRRPNALTFTGTATQAGPPPGMMETPHAFDKDKVWARGPMPATLDEALDFWRGIRRRILTADLLYLPHDARSRKTRPRLGRRAKIGDQSCDHRITRRWSTGRSGSVQNATSHASSDHLQEGSGQLSTT